MELSGLEEVQGHQCSPSPAPPSSPPDPIPRGDIQSLLDTSRDSDLTTSLGNLFQRLTPHLVRKNFKYWIWASLCPPLTWDMAGDTNPCSILISGRCRDTGSPWASSSPGCTPPALSEDVFQTLPQLHSLSDPLQHLNVPLAVKGQNWTQHSGVASTGDTHCPCAAAHTALDTDQMFLATCTHLALHLTAAHAVSLSPSTQPAKMSL